MTARLNTTSVRLRADAERNRAKILEAAAQVFAEQGLDATLDEVAAAAGVGVGTVYRRFPDKDALIGRSSTTPSTRSPTWPAPRRAKANSWEALVWFLEEALQRQCCESRPARRRRRFDLRRRPH